MVDPQIISFINEQLKLGQSVEVIRSSLLTVGWSQADVSEALAMQSSDMLPEKTAQESTATAKPKIATFFSVVLFLLALLNIPSAFAGSFVVLVLNRAMSNIPGGLEYSGLRALPFLWLVSLPSILMLPLLFFAAIKVKSGSQSGWTTSLVVLVIFLLSSLLTGFLVTSLVGPLMNIANQK